MKVGTLLIALGVATITTAENSTESIGDFKDRARGIFNVISFPNVGCPGTNGRNGTCYTTSECTSRAGTASGSCANGYGVCCIIQVLCGTTTSENNTYLIMESTTTPPASCVYTICPSSSNICRIKLDFKTFDTAQPVASPIAAGANAVKGIGSALGDCTTDYFSVSSPGNRGSPQICGFNTGQHVFVDSSPQCTKVAYRSTTNSGVSRQYEIQVIQYACTDEVGGPSDCLQYFTGETGTIKSFNFRDNNGVIADTVTHLSNQNYDICIRRGLGKCGICYSPTFNPGANTEASFGLSNPTASVIAASTAEGSCSTDYIVIPNGAGPGRVIGDFPSPYASRYCGRYLSDVAEAAASLTICSFVRPFRVTVRFDADEVVPGTPASTSITDELSGMPGGTLGFSLNYWQQSCP